MVTEGAIRPYPGEPWGLDNGAFAAWKNGTEWDERRYWRRVYWAAEQEFRPLLAILPDRVADPSSLAFSLEWWERLARFDLPWYLAVQDGMDPDQIAELLPFFSGLFLGGSDRFKATAQLWCNLAHAAGKRFHYGRAGTPRKLRHALDVGADSADSAFPLWSVARFDAFSHRWQHGSPQLRLLVASKAVRAYRATRCHARDHLCRSAPQRFRAAASPNASTSASQSSGKTNSA
jgi:hypothetical protein